MILDLEMTQADIDAMDHPCPFCYAAIAMEKATETKQIRGDTDGDFIVEWRIAIRYKNNNKVFLVTDSDTETIAKMSQQGDYHPLKFRAREYDSA